MQQTADMRDAFFCSLVAMLKEGSMERGGLSKVVKGRVLIEASLALGSIQPSSSLGWDM